MFTFVHLDSQLSQDRLCKRLPFLHGTVLASLSESTARAGLGPFLDPCYSLDPHVSPRFTSTLSELMY